MAQLCGIVELNKVPDDAKSAIETMASRMRRQHQAVARLWVREDQPVALAAIEAGELGGMALLDAADATAGVCLLDGAIYQMSAQAKEVAGDWKRADPNVIPLLYRRFGADLLSHIDGSFCVVIYDARRCTMLVATDRFATRSMFWTVGGKGFAYSSELKSLLVAPSIRARLSTSAMSQLFMFHRLVGDMTLIEGIHRLTPGTVVEFNLDTRQCQTRKYWRAEVEITKRLPLTRDRVEALSESFYRGFTRRLNGAGRIGLSLSGGLDSRAIAAVLGREKASFASCTTGMENCIDQKLAEQISPLVGSQHTFYCVTQAMIRQYPHAIRRAVFLSDGMIVEGGFPAGFTDRFCLEHKVQTLFRGHGGENAKLQKAWPFVVDDAVLRLPRADLFDEVYKRLIRAPSFLDLNRLFPDPQFKVTKDEALLGIKEVLDEFDGGLTSAEVMSLLYLTQNDGIMVPTTRNGLRGVAEMALPFLDYEFMDGVLATDVKGRLGTEIHQQIVKENFAKLMRIANSNTGAPLDASPLRLALTDKMNSLFRRLHVPGFRHYHYMEQWIKDTLAVEMRAIIFDPRSTGRGLFDPAYVQQIVDRAAGDASLSRLVDLFVNIETWCRLFLDGEGSDPSVADLIPLK